MEWILTLCLLVEGDIRLLVRLVGAVHEEEMRVGIGAAGDLGGGIDPVGGAGEGGAPGGGGGGGGVELVDPLEA